MTEHVGVVDTSAGDDYVPFSAAGDSAKGEFRCSECGYGVTVYRSLPVCPSCSAESWEPGEWSPFTRLTE
ncbi:MAG: hydrogenase maturation nickel metallochaperone HypA [Actinomycetota bacterium]|nr:hydrogenase maturation nickel metallochaperone HypA [Actinomycetota bacterium]